MYPMDPMTTLFLPSDLLSQRHCHLQRFGHIFDFLGSTFLLILLRPKVLPVTKTAAFRDLVFHPIS